MPSFLARPPFCYPAGLSLSEFPFQKLQPKPPIPCLDLNSPLVACGWRRRSARLCDRIRHNPVRPGHKRKLTALARSKDEKRQHVGRSRVSVQIEVDRPSGRIHQHPRDPRHRRGRGRWPLPSPWRRWPLPSTWRRALPSTWRWGPVPADWRRAESPPFPGLEPLFLLDGCLRDSEGEDSQEKARDILPVTFRDRITGTNC